jgi:transcription initiation factor TFIIB
MSSNQSFGHREWRTRLVKREVDKLVLEMSLPESIKNDSERICDEVMAKNMMSRRSVPVVAASSLYTACRETHTPVTLRDLAAATDSNPREIGRCYRSIINRMQISPPELNGTRYAARVASAAKASPEATELSLQIVKNSIKRGLGGRNPMTLAAAAVYLACLITGEDSRQSDVAEAAGVSEVSVRECIKAVRHAGAV